MNSTVIPPVSGPASSSGGLAAGLTVFFLLVAIAAGGVVYKFHGKIRNVLQSAQRRDRQKGDYPEATEAHCHQYTSLDKEQSAGHAPIYENLATRAAGPAEHASRSPDEHEEDLYLQCDVPDDAIYSNDPQCNLAILPSSQEEDVYIMPDT